ncbi:MAG: hypothetical protein ACLP59_01950 [Bryobacteraceae bacterium]
MSIPLADLLIGVSALELGYALGTGNARHFQLIPGLDIVRYKPPNRSAIPYP